jgi:hypothetical protein
MKKTYKTALGKVIDLDGLMAQNETTIAVGNQKVNARGDELGPGGRIARTRDQVMKDYYALKTPTAVDENLPNTIAEQQKTARLPQAQGKAVDLPVAPEPVVIPDEAGFDEEDMGAPEVEPVETDGKSLRSSFAGSVAKQVTVTQKPLPNPKKAKGVKRF